MMAVGPGGVTRHRPVPQDGADPIQHLGHIPTTLWVERAFPEIDVARAAHEKNVTRPEWVGVRPGGAGVACDLLRDIPAPAHAPTAAFYTLQVTVHVVLCCTCMEYDSYVWPETPA